MRIFVHEFASGGGFAGREIPRSLAREGRAMLKALVTDLGRAGHEVVTTVDARLPMRAAAGVQVVLMPSKGRQRDALVRHLLDSSDAVWLIAPETDNELARLASMAETRGKLLLGSSAGAIRVASDKARLPSLLERWGIPHPATQVLTPRSGIADWTRAAARVGYPVVVKPARGAGCDRVSLATRDADMARAVIIARGAPTRGSVIVQRYVEGVAASVALVADGRSAKPLAVSRQFVSRAHTFTYRGGSSPLDHRLAPRAADLARRAVEAVPGLRGYLGVDVVLSPTDAVVIEINPRLTTAYLGLRAVVDDNVASWAIAAAAGTLPSVLPLKSHVRFTASGRVTRQ